MCNLKIHLMDSNFTFFQRGCKRGDYRRAAGNDARKNPRVSYFAVGSECKKNPFFMKFPKENYYASLQ